MRTLLVIATAVEIVLVLVVLVVYLLAITRSLRRTSVHLAKVSFGVRAIESQCAPIGPSVVRINEQLETIAGVLHDLGDLAEAGDAGGGVRRG